MRKLRQCCVVGATLAAGVVMAEGDSGLRDPEVSRRTQALVEANIVATHAYQVNLALQSGKGDPKAWSAQGLSTNDLAALIQHQQKLLAGPVGDVVAWVRGQNSAFDPARDLNPILASPLRASATNLPVNVLAKMLGERGASGIRVRALASLLQMMLDIDRDGTQLQDMFVRYAALGLPVHTAQLGLQETTDAEFLVLAQRLSPALCVSPFETDPVTVRMLFRKMWNWGHRHTGERDKTVLARELMNEPDIQALLPRIRAMPAQKIAVIGHSFTMYMHWSSPAAFVPIVAEIFALANPKVEVRQWQAGGMNASRADCQKFYQEALAWKPDRVLIVVANKGPKDPPALERMTAGFAAQGIEVMMPDTIYDGLTVDTKYYWEPDALREIARKTGIVLLPSGAVIDASPDKDRLVSLDHVHMTEPYHRLMARIWLRFLTAPQTESAAP